MFRNLVTRFFPWLVYLSLFLLPWQTRYIYDQKLIAGAPFEYGTMSVYAVELLIILAFFVGQRLNIRREHQASVKAMGILLVASAVSIMFSRNVDLSFGAWSHLLFATLLFVLVLDQRVDRWKALQAFSLGLISPAVLGFSQVFSGISPASKWFGLATHRAADLGTAVVEMGGDRLLRAYGSFPHPNIFGGYLVIGLLSTLFLLLRSKQTKAWQIVEHLFFLMLSFALIATFSRSAWLALAFSFCVGLFLLIRKHRSKLRPHLHLSLFLLFSFLLPCLIFFRPLTSRFDSGDRLEQISVQDRVGQYARYPSVVGTNWMSGVGDGAYTVALSEQTAGQPAWWYQPIHNTILLVLAEVGLLGGLAAVFWASRVDKYNYAAIRKGSLGAIGGIMFGSIPLVIIFFDHYIWSSWSGLALLTFLMAMTLRLSEE